ncbi:hypothetical protein [Pararhodospirillum oryzae]|uniref:Uncharacterized protein n=1 Tax=Pararhodospirillum oryzae TaxID=478448 RepID=A0A512H779_9PROT|nr:hypothetical protein [Pararhodospirillum oryzae]GEO81291.1 hypothetical protein ROR02_14220 [Pararhodospirillum oryzae]
MKLSLLGLIGLGILGSVVLAVGLVIALTTLKANDNLLALSESRWAFVARQVEAQIQTGFSLGLDLDSQTNIGQVLNTVAERNQRLESIEVFDETGKVLFAAGPHPVRPRVPESVRATILAQPAGTIWNARDRDGLHSGLALVNSFGQTDGGLVLVSSRGALDAIAGRIFADILRGCLPIAAVAAAIALMAVWVVFAGSRHSFNRACAGLEGLEQRQTPAFDPDPDSPVEQAVGAFRDHVGVGWQALDAARQRLDDLEK